MRRAYNHKISVRANENMYRRELRVRLQRVLIAIAAVVLVSLAILLGNGIKAFAHGEHRSIVHKYYTSIEVAQGDSLWSIAREYTAGTNIKVFDYMDEVKRLNQLPNDTIHEGGNLVISYYSTEEK